MRALEHDWTNLGLEGSATYQCAAIVLEHFDMRTDDVLCHALAAMQTCQALRMERLPV